MSRRKPVFVLSRGERCEGGTVVGVFRTIELAKAFAEDYHKKWSCPPLAVLVWRADDSTSLSAWTNSVDYLLIETFEVQS